MPERLLIKTAEGIQLDPRTTVYLLLLINIVIFATNPSGFQLIAKGALAAIPFALLCSAGKWKQSFIYAVLYVVGQLAETYLTAYAAGLWGLLMRFTAQMLNRLVPIVIMAYYLIRTMEVSAFIAAMERMHITRKIVIPLAVIFRFFPTIGEEYHAINDAMRMRGIGFRGSPLAMLEYRLVPLMMSIARIGNELSAAALTRGLSITGERTNIYKIGFGVQDAVFGLWATAAAILFFIL
ncbi:energy-coupling factor transporter transmembrane component T [Faecalicatena contorta]|uniref:Energy-coupling factor transport system permease protein n=1 Tax=Faecalicatena contorta TaxID=39482 RepID=A0A315ZZW0_9FIRM|nr:energy-coupling factor transporter transmembrane component T [Faecalicatena contorta]PWJ49994.1 energy-coupling factor transport system permease protein [Faecalicatena contorta]SUQ14115.1 energy-coupling factor transport system permease protein [Faecalicatena contorta]